MFLPVSRNSQYRNGMHCVISDDCLSDKCSKCPVDYMCGKPIGDSCSNDNECCTDNCDNSECKEKEGKQGILFSNNIYD